MYIIKGVSFAKKCKIINELKSVDINANVTIGGIEVYPDGKFQEKVLADFVRDNNLLMENACIATAV